MTSPLRATAASASEQPDSSALLSDQYKALRNEVLALLQKSNSVPGGDLPSAMEYMKATVLDACARLYDSEVQHPPADVSVDFLHSAAWTLMAVDVFPEEHPIHAKMAVLDTENVQQAPEYAEYFEKRQRALEQGLVLHQWVGWR